MKKTILRTYVRQARPVKKWHDRFDLLTNDLLPKIHNMTLHECRQLEKNGDKMLTFYDMCSNKFLNRIRKKFPEIKKYNACIARSLFKRISHAIDAYKAKIRKMPRYKGKNRSIKSFDIPFAGFHIRKSGYRHPMANNSKIKTNGPHWGVFIKGFGFCRFEGDPPKGNIKELTVKKTAKRVIFAFKVEEEIEISDRQDDPVTGIDAGVDNMITLSTGEMIPGRIRDTDRIKGLQRKLAGQKQGSNSWNKTKKKIAKEWQSITDSEKGFMHRLTTDLVRNHGPNFAIEDRIAKSLTKKDKKKKWKRHSNRMILEQCWGMFGNMLTYKAEGAGGGVDRVNAAYTSQDCHICGNRKKVGKTYDCEKCGMKMHRDENAAIVIAMRSLKIKPGGTEPGGVRLRCSLKQSEQGKHQKDAHGRLHAAPSSVYGMDNQAHGSYSI